MIIKADGCPDPRWYYTHTTPEIAVLLLGDGYSEGVMNRDIVLYAHSAIFKGSPEHIFYDLLLMYWCFPKVDRWHIHDLITEAKAT